MIEGGYIYIAQPPLYKITKGKDARYAFTDDEKFAVLKDMGIEVDEAETEGEGDDDETGEPAPEEETSTKKQKKASIQR